MNYRQYAAPLISIGAAEITFAQIVNPDQAYEYELAVFGLSDSNPEQTEIKCSIERYLNSKAEHSGLPGADSANPDSYVFLGHFTLEEFRRFAERPDRVAA